jgi:methylenetetrahydrofolate reductase (NADPH)
MRSFTSRFEGELRRGSRLLQSSQVRSLSFSTSAQSSQNRPDFNVILFAPRNEEHFQKFQSEYPRFLRSPVAKSIKSISVTDIAHNPENNQKAIELLIGRGISPAMIIPHLALIANDKDETDRKIQFFRDQGVQSMFVIRGNPLVIGKGLEHTHHPQGYEDVSILMKRIKQLAPNMKIIVAGYPNKHPYARDREKDLDSLKRKVDAGADAIITQHFFDNEVFLWFYDQCQQRRIDIPIIPTVLPIGNPKYLYSFSREAGVDIPAEITQILFQNEGMKVTDSSIKDKVIEGQAVEYTTRQIQNILDLKLSRVPKINTYTANHTRFLGLVLDNLGIGKDQSVAQETQR